MVTGSDITGTAAATLVVLSMILAGGGIVFAAQPAAADHGSPGDYDVVLPDDDDHLPGDQNEEGASIQHFASLDGAFDDAPADEYEVLEWLVISSDEVTFGGCDTDDTSVFGIDRGNNNDGTQTDVDLLQHRKDSAFLENQIQVEFFDDGDLGGDSVDISEDDAIVAVQNDCYTMPEEPGWYQIQGMVNGTGPDGEFFELSLESHYFPVCEGCHDEETAEEQLGPAPSQDSTDDPTPTPTPTPDEEETTATPDDSTPTPTDEPVDDSTPTPTDEPVDDSTPTPTDEPADTDESAGGDEGSDGPMTPAAGDGAGFGPAVALLAVLASAFLLRRR